MWESLSWKLEALVDGASNKSHEDIQWSCPREGLGGRRLHNTRPYVRL